MMRVWRLLTGQRGVDAPTGWAQADATRGFSSINPPNQAQAEVLASAMPKVAGQTLEAPFFKEMSWKVNQKFSEADDPDRVSEPWTAPDFTRRIDPKSVVSTFEDLPLTPGTNCKSFARVVRNALSEEWCRELFSKVNVKGFTPALTNLGLYQQLLPDYRNGHRVIVDSPELAAWLFEVLRAYLPEEINSGRQRAKLVCLNERLRFLCYTPGQFFDRHRDGMFMRPAGHPDEGDFSAVTVQVYLHNVPQEFGGATAFFMRDSRGDRVAHQPEAGSALIFSQDLEHEGQLVTQGLKYTLRTEAMYRRLQ